MSDLVPLPLVLTAEQKRQIETRGCEIFPNECCGIIYGREMVGKRVVEELEAG